jgi:methylthioribose-1-phosphate isomerase
MAPASAPLRGVAWEGGLDDGRLVLLDQTRLPAEVRHLDVVDIETLRRAILDLVVRGAPAIGIASAYGLVLHLTAEAKRDGGTKPSQILAGALAHAAERLLTSRPTAVNLAWAVERMRSCFTRHNGHLTALEMCARLLMEAKRIHREDAEQCTRIADNGAALLPPGGILTHCNTGALATGGVGTALGAIVHAHQRGKRLTVYAGETRPLFQGARLTASELQHAGIPVHLIADSAAASLMARGKIQAVIVGADRICANGDTANKIGTYALAVLARHHGLPFFVAAPSSSFDLTLHSGHRVEIEERSPAEIRGDHAPADVTVDNPAFDITPADLITAIITERGVIHRPDPESIRRMLA